MGDQQVIGVRWEAQHALVCAAVLSSQRLELVVDAAPRVVVVDLVADHQGCAHRCHLPLFPKAALCRPLNRSTRMSPRQEI